MINIHDKSNCATYKLYIRAQSNKILGHEKSIILSTPQNGHTMSTSPIQSLMQWNLFSDTLYTL
jgi:hypothetical protein